MITSLSLNSKGTVVIVKANPDNSGIRFFLLKKQKLIWDSTLIDGGESVFYCQNLFGFLKLKESSYQPRHKTPYKHHTEELNVKTPHNNEIFAKIECRNNKDKMGVFVVGFKNPNDETLILAKIFCGSENTGILFL